MVAKVADLGPCAAAKQRLRSSGNVSSIRALSHVAPEVLRKSDAGPLGLEADIYAFGIMMWELYTGQQAYRKLRDAAHLYEVRSTLQLINSYLLLCTRLKMLNAQDPCGRIGRGFCCLCRPRCATTNTIHVGSTFLL